MVSDGGGVGAGDWGGGGGYQARGWGMGVRVCVWRGKMGLVVGAWGCANDHLSGGKSGKSIYFRPFKANYQGEGLKK